ncbi:MAG: hypothetical protein ACQEVA_15935 [Myxococcota bacterium]
MRRFLVLLLVVGLLVAGCSSTNTKPDEEVAESSAQVSTPPITVPEGTFMLLRMDVAEMDDAMGHVAEVLNVVAEFSYGSDHPSKRVLAAMLRRPHQWSQTLNAEEFPADAFRGLDTSGTVWAALSTQGNEPLLSALENGVPDYGTGMIPRGVFVRLRLPASDPEALAKWLEGACGEMLDCTSQQALEARDDAVVIDYRMGDVPSVLEQAGKSAALPAPEPDPSFLERDTSAFRAFVQTEAALGAYAVSDRLVDPGALSGMTEAMEALASATPRHRDRLYARGMGVAGYLYLLRSPGAHEVADSAAFFRVSDEFGFTIDSVQSLTEVGEQVSEAAATEASVSKVMTDRPIVSADVSYDVASAMDAAIVPAWLDASDPDAMRKIADVMRTGGMWTYLVPYHQYPMGFAKGMRGFAADMGSGSSAAGLFEQLRGFRLAFDLKQVEDGAARLAPVGGLAAVLDTESDVSRNMSQLKAMVDRQLPFSITAETVEVDGREEARVWAGEGVEFGDAEPVDGTMEASIDMAALGEFLRSSEVGNSRAREMAAKVFEKLSRVRLNARRVDNATHVRLTVAGPDIPAIEIPTGAASPGQPEAISACLDEARQASRQALSTLNRRRDDERAELQPLIDDLERIESTCEEAGEVVRWMRAQWLVRLGVDMADRLRWAEAEAAFEKACELTSAKECRWMERLTEARDATPLASVPRAASFEPSQPIRVRLTEASLRSTTFASVLGLQRDREMDLDDVSWEDDATRAQAEDFVRFLDAQETLSIAVSPDADASVLARLVGMTDSKRMQRQRRLLGQEDGDAPLLVVPVRVDDGELGALAFAPASSLGPPDVEVELGPDTDVDLESLSKKVGLLWDGAHVGIVVEQGVAFDKVATVASAVGQAFEGEDGEIRMSLDTAE